MVSRSAPGSFADPDAPSRTSVNNTRYLSDSIQDGTAPKQYVRTQTADCFDALLILHIVSTPALTLASELIRLYTMEAIHRSAATAHKDESNTKDIGDSARMDVNHLHKNAAALTLDFGG